MLDFLKSQKRFADDISIFEIVGGEDDNEDMELIDTLTADNYDANIEHKRYLMVLEEIQDYTDTLDPKTRKIISMYMNRRSFDEIAHYVRLSKSTVYKCVKAFRRVMAFRLGLDIEV